MLADLSPYSTISETRMVINLVPGVLAGISRGAAVFIVDTFSTAALQSLGAETGIGHIGFQIEFAQSSP